LVFQILSFLHVFWPQFWYNFSFLPYLRYYQANERVHSSVKFVTFNRKVLGSNLRRDTDYAGGFHGFPHTIRENGGMTLQIKLRLFPFVFIPIHEITNHPNILCYVYC
jgi:hypothetical protein